MEAMSDGGTGQQLPEETGLSPETFGVGGVFRLHLRHTHMQSSSVIETCPFSLSSHLETRPRDWKFFDTPSASLSTRKRKTITLSMACFFFQGDSLLQ